MALIRPPKLFFLLHFLIFYFRCMELFLVKIIDQTQSWQSLSRQKYRNNEQVILVWDRSNNFTVLKLWRHLLKVPRVDMLQIFKSPINSFGICRDRSRVLLVLSQTPSPLRHHALPSETAIKTIYTYKSSLQIHILKEFGQIGRLCTTI